MEFGIDALDQVPVLGHRCDNPLCQRIGPGHVEASSAWRNWQEWVMRHDSIGGPLRDARGAQGWSRALRDVVRRDPTAVSLSAAIGEGMAADAAQVPLWGPGSLDAEIGTGSAGRDCGWPTGLRRGGRTSPFVVAVKLIRGHPS